MKMISLEEVLEKYFSDSGASTKHTLSDDRADLGAVNRSRDKEVNLRSKLPSSLVRRLDKGFARSNTVHPDTGRILYTLASLERVKNIFETGTYWGYSTTYLAAAMQDKQADGKVYTFDLYDKAGAHIPQNLISQIVFHRGKPGTEMMPQVLKEVAPELFFQDSVHDHDGVLAELNVIVSWLKPGAIVLFHDFFEPVQDAAIEALKGWDVYQLNSDDPQPVGIAVLALT